MYIQHAPSEINKNHIYVSILHWPSITDCWHRHTQTSHKVKTVFQFAHGYIYSGRCCQDKTKKHANKYTEKIHDVQIHIVQQRTSYTSWSHDYPGKRWVVSLIFQKRPFSAGTRFYTSRTRGSLGAREFLTNDSDGARTGARSLPMHAEIFLFFFPAGKFSRSNRARSRRKECFIPKSVSCCTIVQKFKFYALEFQNSTIISFCERRALCVYYHCVYCHCVYENLERSPAVPCHMAPAPKPRMRNMAPALTPDLHTLPCPPFTLIIRNAPKIREVTLFICSKTIWFQQKPLRLIKTESFFLNKKIRPLFIHDLTSRWTLC